MKREDLRSKIIPTTIGNTDASQKTGYEEFNTTDFIYLDSYNEQYDGKKTNMEISISATDYAKMNNAVIYIYGYDRTRTGRKPTEALLRSASTRSRVYCVVGTGNWFDSSTGTRNAGLCPSLHYHLPSDISARSALRFLKGQKNREQSEELEQFDIREVKDIYRKNYISYITNWGICKNKSRRRFE